jgi:hypothetical protein
MWRRNEAPLASRVWRLVRGAGPVVRGTGVPLTGKTQVSCGSVRVVSVGGGNASKSPHGEVWRV